MLLALGFGLQGLSGVFIAGFNINMTTFDVLWTSALQGLGVGLIWVPLTIVTFRTMDPSKTAEATAIFHLIRNFGSSIFISISIAVAQRSARTNYAEMSEFASPMNEALSYQFSFYNVYALDSARALAGLSSEIARQAVMIGYLNTFLLFAATSFAAIPILFFFRMRK